MAGSRQGHQPVTGGSGAPGVPFVTALLAGIALLDLTTGAYLLTSETPWAAHGAGTVWSGVPAMIAAAPDQADAVWASFRRLGAFSVQAGLGTGLVAWLGHRDLRVQGLMLAVWTTAGVAFGATDAAWFSGTTYHLGKQAIGAGWVLGLLLWVRAWRQAASDRGADPSSRSTAPPPTPT